MSEKKSFIRKAISYATPWRSISRSAESVKGSAGRIADAARQARDAMLADHQRIKQAREARLTPEQAAMSPAELFQHHFEIQGWSETGLQNNRIAYRRAKWACMTVAAVAAGVGLWYLVASPNPLLAHFVAPALLVAALIVVSRGALEAWKQAQVELRVVMSFVQFASRPDFFKRLVV